MSKKLLLADDSITIQKVIGITFVNEDYQLTVVDNGDAAFEKAKAELPDLILADVFMPGKNGYELCAAVKQEPALAHVPVLLLAGTFEPFDEDKARNCGADGWIAKPFESQTLIDRVEELLAKTPAVAPTAAPEVPAPAAAAATAAPSPEPASAAVGADLWADVEPSAEAAAPVEDLADDDIWSAVSFDEDDLFEGSDASSSAEQEVWSDVEDVTVPEDEPLAETFDVPAAEQTAPEVVLEGGLDEGDDLFVFEDGPIEELGDGDALEVIDEADDFIIEEEEPQGMTEAVSAAAEVFEDDTEILALDDDDILPLDDDDIIVEEELVSEQVESSATAAVEELTPEQTPVAAAVEEALLEEDLEPVEDLAAAFEGSAHLTEPGGLEEALVAEAQGFMEEPAAVDEEIAFDEPLAVEEDLAAVEPEAVAPEVASGETAGAEKELAFEEPVALEEQVAVGEPAEAEQDDFLVEPEAEWAAAEEPAPARSFGEVPAAAAAAAAVGGVVAAMTEPPAAAPAAGVAEVEAQAAALSEEQLAEVVERVAGTVIERLANTILEKIAWEVVPDLAESLIQEEIRKIKEQVE